ncbi:MAG: phage late control D family protein [Oscillospiraceae bacterium]
MLTDQHLPQFKIYIDNSLLKGTTYKILSVNVQLSISEKANSADFVVSAEYDIEKGKIESNLVKKLNAGAKVKIEMGYKFTSTVFLGYINSCDVEFSSDGVYLTVSCLDARGLLMGNRLWKVFENATPSQIINKLLLPLSKYTQGISVSLPGAIDKEHPEAASEDDDYTYICNLAKRNNCSFLMQDNVLKFGKNVLTQGTPMFTTYEWGKNLLSFSRQVELSGQIGEVEVSGRNPDTLETFSASEKLPSGPGKNAKQLCSNIGSKTLKIVSSEIKTKKEAEAYAKSIITSSSMKLVNGSASMVGDSSIMPGKKIKFGKLDSAIDGQYLVSAVTHKFDSSGYITTVNFCRGTA